MMTVSDKVLENRLRRIATRRGLTIEKSRTRDPKALKYGLYLVRDQDGNPTGLPRTLSELEGFLT